MNANPEKSQLILLGNTGSHTLQICDITTKSVSSVTLLGIIIDSELNFKEHVNKIIKKVYHKLYTLRRPRKFLT